MIKNEKRAHDLAIKVVELNIQFESIRKDIDNSEIYKIYINAYNDFLEALNRENEDTN